MQNPYILPNRHNGQHLDPHYEGFIKGIEAAKQYLKEGFDKSEKAIN